MGICLDYSNRLLRIIPHVSLCFSSRVYKYAFFCVWFHMAEQVDSALGAGSPGLHRAYKEITCQSTELPLFCHNELPCFPFTFFKSNYNKVVH